MHLRIGLGTTQPYPYLFPEFVWTWCEQSLVILFGFGTLWTKNFNKEIPEKENRACCCFDWGGSVLKPPNTKSLSHLIWIFLVRRLEYVNNNIEFQIPELDCSWNLRSFIIISQERKSSVSDCLCLSYQYLSRWERAMEEGSLWIQGHLHI